MNTPKNIKRYILGYGFVNIRPYLTYGEIDSIIHIVQDTTYDYAYRLSIANAYVMNICTDIKEFHKDNVDADIFTLFYVSKIFKRVTKYIVGYDILIKGIDALAIKDINHQFETSIADMEKSIENVNLDEKEEKFRSALDELRGVYKKKEEILNG